MKRPTLSLRWPPIALPQRPALALTALTLAASPQACEPEKLAPAAVIRIADLPTPQARRAAIREKIVRVCAEPLSDAMLERVATVVERYVADRDVTAVVASLSSFDAQARACRRKI